MREKRQREKLWKTNVYFGKKEQIHMVMGDYNIKENKCVLIK